MDRTERRPVDCFRDYGKRGRKANELVTEWAKAQANLESVCMSSKETAKVSCEERKLSDLDKLVSLGGPFTTPKQVGDYLKKKKSSNKEKRDRLYIEVR